MSRYLTDLADILRAAGLEVVELAGWKTRAATLNGKPGPFDPKGILCHHTAGTGDGKGYAEWMATGGYPPTLYPPLAQLGLDRDGVWYVQAAGRANHAGRCRPIAGLQTLPGKSYGDGNTQLLGVEAMNTGNEGWTATQYGSYVRGVAALNAAYDWDIVLGHKETSLEGKVDPSFDMDQFRTDVKQGDPAMTREQLDQILDAIDRVPRRTWSHQLPDPREPGKSTSASSWVRMANLKAGRAGDAVGALTTLVAAALDNHAGAGPVSIDRDDLEAAMRSVLGSLDDAQDTADTDTPAGQ